MQSGWATRIGYAMRGVRAGMHGLACNRPWLRSVPECIRVSSTAFGHGTDIPERYTADGAGLSPPLAWEGVPPGTASLVLLVEDPDIPFVVPLVHLVAYGLPPTLTGLTEGALAQRPGTEGMCTGRNNFGRTGWLPCAPPPGHGPHHYAFQVFALRNHPRFDWPPGRHALLGQMRAEVLGWGVLFGVYERG